MRHPLRFLLPPAMAMVALLGLWSFPGQEEEARPLALAPGSPPVPDRGADMAGIPDSGLAVTPPAVRSAPPRVSLQPARNDAQRTPTKADAPAGALRNTLPLPPDFLDRIVAASGQIARFALPDGTTASGTVDLLKSDESGVLSVQGRLDAPAPGSYFFQRQTLPGVAGALVGHVRFHEKSSAWRVDPSGPEGTPVLNPVRQDQVVCMGLPMPETSPATVDGAKPPTSPTAAAAPSPAAGDPQFAPQTHPTNMAIPAVLNGVIPLQSLPGATGVIYLDFDGEPGPFTGWGSVTGDAAPSGATNAQIMEVWQRVAEDYQIFNLNITTDRRVFDRAAETSRQHVVITPTSTAAPGAGGVAFIGSFDWSGDTVCWVFIRTGKSAAEAIAHEVGHTLGLSHDGRTAPVEDYYGGHGSGDVAWAPIMGVGYSRNLSQWSRGEYAAADNTEDDLTIITSNNNSVDYRADDTATTYAAADYLDILPSSAVSNEGIIETRSDVDAWRFQTAGGLVSLTVSPVNAGPNLDVLAEIYTSANNLIASSNPDTTLGASVATSLGAGDYTLRVSGVGRGTALTTGYTDYGSLGAYLISGSVANGVRADRFTLDENTPDGTPLGTIPPRNDHGANPASYAILSGNTGGAFSIDPATGLLSVAHTAALDYETLSTRWDDPANFELLVSLTDSVNPLLSEILRVVVMVNPVNEAPSLTGGSATLFTRTRAGVPVLGLTGSDPDRFDFPLFSIAAGNTGGAFAIDPVSGLISTTVNAPDQLPATPYTLTVRATDRGSPGLTGDATVTIAVLEAPAGYRPGGLMRTYFENITGNTVANLTSQSKFPNAPDAEALQSLCDDASHGNNYGSTARGWLLPPATGNYTFWITSDDAAELRLSPNATPASALVRASASSATGRYQYNKFPGQQSIALPLTAGQPYYLEARHKQGTGADHLVLAWQGPGFSRQIISGIHLAPYQQNYAPRLAPQSFALRRGADTGARIGTVVAREINPGDTPGSFTITGGSAAPWCGLDANTGLLYVSDAAALEAASAAAYSLTVRVSDNGSPALTATGTITLNVLGASAVNTTGIVQQIWTGISGGTVALLTADARFPHSPGATRTLSGFDTGADYADSYGSRIRAWVTVPVTGSYVFSLAGDDESQLRFTTGSNYATAPLIAWIANSTVRNNWTTFPSQKSATFPLTAGQRAYLEVRHKEGSGQDFVQVAWTGPGMAAPTIIPASALEPFDLNAPPLWSSAAYRFTVRQSAAPGSPAGTVSATDPEGALPVYSITAGNSGGAFAINPFTGIITVANPAALVPGTTLVLALRVQDNGVSGVYPYKTAVSTASILVQPDFFLVRPATRTVNLPAHQGLDLEATPSGRPGATVDWTMVSGPGTVTFDEAPAYHTGARFSTPGRYLLRGTETAAGNPLTVECFVQSGISPLLTGADRIGVQTALSSHGWNGGEWELSAGGSGFPEGPADSFYFINQPASLTATITARITQVQNLNNHHSVAGVMIRENAAAGARSLFCGITSQNGRRLMVRTTPGLPAVAAGTENPAPASPPLPVWVRLTRSGSTFTASSAPDIFGAPGPFTVLGSPQTFPMASSCLIGLAAASGSPDRAGTSVIDNLSITPSLVNLAPLVNATGPAVLTESASTLLGGTVDDDARPALPGTSTSTWSQHTGPGTVTFGSPATGSTSASFSKPGDYRLRLTADDGEVRTFRELALTVRYSPLEAWRTLQFGPASSTPFIAGDTADPDGDGLANLLEYVLGLAPLSPDRPALSLDKPGLDGASYLRLTVTRHPAATDVSLVIETSPEPANPDSWRADGTVVEIDTPVTLRARTTQPIGSQPAQFLRLRAFR